MKLADEIRSLGQRTLADLTLVYDYQQDTVAAWLVVNQVFRTEADTIEVSRSNQNRLAVTNLAEKTKRYVNEYLIEATFQQLLAVFENFLFDLFRLWLTAYPQSMGRRTIDFASVLSLPDKAAITDLVISQELNQITYKRVADWFAALDDRVKLGCPAPDEIERIAEAKASRDLLAHNRGIVNTTYLTKAGRLARYREGERIEVIDPYHREVWELLRKVVGDMTHAAETKAN